MALREHVVPARPQLWVRPLMFLSCRHTILDPPVRLTSLTVFQQWSKNFPNLCFGLGVPVPPHPREKGSPTFPKLLLHQLPSMVWAHEGRLRGSPDRVPVKERHSCWESSVAGVSRPTPLPWGPAHRRRSGLILAWSRQPHFCCARAHLSAFISDLPHSPSLPPSLSLSSSHTNHPAPSLHSPFSLL